MKKKTIHRIEARQYALEAELDEQREFIAYQQAQIDKLEYMLKGAYCLLSLENDHNLMQALGIVADEFCYYDKLEKIHECNHDIEKAIAALKDIRAYFKHDDKEVTL